MYVCVQSLHLCLIFCDPMNCTLPVFSVHGFLQARILECVAIPSFRGSWPRDQSRISCVSCNVSKFFPAELKLNKPKSDYKVHLYVRNIGILRYKLYVYSMAISPSLFNFFFFLKDFKIWAICASFFLSSKNDNIKSDENLRNEISCWPIYFKSRWWFLLIFIRTHMSCSKI